MNETESGAFPRLSADDMERVAADYRLVHLHDGDRLFRAGESDYDFFIVKSGAVEILEDSTGEPARVTLHGPREFTGDVDMLTGRPALVTAVARGPTEVYSIPNRELRRIIEDVPSLSEKLLEAFRLRRTLLEESDFLGVSIVGPRDCKDTSRVREFLYKNHVPATWFDSESEAGEARLSDISEAVAPSDRPPMRGEGSPVVFCPPETCFVEPSLIELAECVGIKRDLPNRMVDVAIVGAGPAGLAAAIYAASEGLSTVVLDALGPGGQAGSSSRIENFIGFPSGISGAELANRAHLQILKFGGKVSAPVSVQGIRGLADGYRLELDIGDELRAHAVIAATGARYRRLPAEALNGFRGAGIFYSATTVEAHTCRETPVVVVGGGNSAAQAAVYLSSHAESVLLVCRGDDLEAGMSEYLADRIREIEGIEVRLGSEVVSVRGDDAIEEVEIAGEDGSAVFPCRALFVFIGAEPNSDWLPDAVARDEEGFVLTGARAGRSELWRLDRDPCPLETTLPGVIAAGDLRAGSTSRVAFAAGDGALAVTCVHGYRRTRKRTKTASSSEIEA